MNEPDELQRGLAEARARKAAGFGAAALAATWIFTIESTTNGRYFSPTILGGGVVAALAGLGVLVTVLRQPQKDPKLVAVGAALVLVGAFRAAVGLGVV